MPIMAWQVLSVVTISLTWLSLTTALPHPNLHGVAYIGVTTDNLKKATFFYTDILGGKLLEELSTPPEGLYGDDHYYRMFGHEISDARRRGLDPVDVGVPDISDSGTYSVKWNFILVGSSLVKLSQFSLRGLSGTDTFPAREPHTSPAVINNMHLCLWMEDSVNPHGYISESAAAQSITSFLHTLRSAAINKAIDKEKVRKKAKTHGFDQVLFNGLLPVDSKEELEKIPDELVAITFPEGDLAGTSFAYFKGPSGEQLELTHLGGQSKTPFGREFCKRGAISPAFIESPENQQPVSKTGKLYGTHNVGIRTPDLMGSVEFYSKVLGGDLMDKPLQLDDLSGDVLQNIVFQKEILDAKQLGVDPRDLMVPTLTTGQGRVDIRFVLVDNTMLELLQYTDGPSLGDPRFNPRLNHTSPAYVNSMQVAFMVDSAANFSQFIDDVEKKAKDSGFANVMANRREDGNGFSPLEGKLDGYNYAFMKGPYGEQLELAQFTGHSEEVLKQALLDHGAVSTAWDETNPNKSSYKGGSMKAYCKQYLEARKEL